MSDAVPRRNAVRHLVEETVPRGRATLLTGPVGLGKSHVLRDTQAALTSLGENAPLVVGTAPASAVPLGAFAGIPELPTSGVESAAAAVDAFARRRSGSVLLVDNVELLDDASLYVVTQLISTTQMPAILTATELSTAPECIQDLYDGGYLTETALAPLSTAEASTLMSAFASGALTPRAEAEILAATGPNPLHLREVIRGSLAEGRLAPTEHGWELRGSPAPTPRLYSLVAERFSRLPTTAIEAATLIALTGECPLDAVDAADLRTLAGAELVENTDCGWLRLSHPLDAHYLLTRGSAALRHEIVHRAIGVLRGSSAAARPHAQRQADLLALDHGCDVDASSLVALAEYALGAFDAQLALRAATSALRIEPDSLSARRVAGLAASLLDQTATADAHFSEARRLASTDEERTSVALAHAASRHPTLRRGEGAPDRSRRAPCGARRDVHRSP